jgi:hypothetical protein
MYGFLCHNFELKVSIVLMLQIYNSLFNETALITLRPKRASVTENGETRNFTYLNLKEVNSKVTVFWQMMSLISVDRHQHF